MTSSSLLQSVVELVLIYLVQSTLFLGGVAGVLLVMNWSRTRSATVLHAVSPMIEERLWKLAAVLPLVTVPLTVFAGWSCAIPNWSPQPTPIVTEDESAEAGPDTFSNEPPIAIPEESIASTMSLLEVADPPAFQVAPADAISIEEPFVVHDELPTTSQPRAESPAVIHQPINQPVIVAIEEPQFTSQPKPENWHSWLGVAFLSVIALSLLRLFVRGFLIQRFLNQCVPADTGLREMLSRLTTRDHKIRILRARAGRVAEPFACGVWRWTIVLPDGIEEHLKPAEMRALLAHEVAHVLRRDPLWLFIGEFLCTALAIQPLNILARRRWLQAAELLCDDWAINQKVSATSLATCLTRIAELRLDRRGSAWGLAAIGRSGLLSRRVEWLLRSNREPERKTIRRSLQVTAVAFALGVLVGTFGPRFVLETPVEAAVETEIEVDRAAIVSELSIALDELQHTESLLGHDSDPKIVAAAARLRTRVQSIRESLSNQGHH